MFRLAVIIGSTRPGRNGEAVARWIYEIAKQRKDTLVKLVDILDYDLSMLEQVITWGTALKPLRKDD